MMFEGEILETHAGLVLLHMNNELVDGIPGRLQLKHQPADFVVQEAGQSLNFQAVAIVNPYFVQIGVCLEVVPATRAKNKHFHVERVQGKPTSGPC